jgi:hypothetical protein
MTNPTTNFGWQMPTPTDLVTDLPADFEVFGQAVDTDFVDLLGGTTGQILSKTSNTDLDFTWITNDVGDITAVNVTSPITGGGSSGAVTIGVSAASTAAAGVVQLSDSTSTTSSVLASTPTATKSAYDLAAAAVPKSTVTTAGDIIYATGSAAVTRLGIGTTGQVLTVNGGGTAPSWTTAAAAGSTLVKRASFSNVASTTTTFDSVFTSTYANYLVIIDTLYAATTADDLQFQMRYGAVTESGGNYYGSTYGSIYNGTQTNTGTNAGTLFTISQSTGSSSFPGSGLIYFNRVGSGSQTPNWNGQYMDMSSSGAAYFFGGQTQTARVYDGFLVKSASTNITGTISVYGLVK